MKKPVSAEADRVLHSFFPGISETRDTFPYVCPIAGLQWPHPPSRESKSQLCYWR